MPWENTPEKRARDKQTYGDPEYRRNKAIVRRRSGGRCEVLGDNGRPCGSRDRVQCDHITPVSQGGTHHLDNLRDACFACHAAKTAREGGARRRGGGWRRRAPDDPPLATRTKW